ncbi:FERRY endosomal RAB5 effector complex subunit 3 isoform X2 [Oratosquilla oratoria]
MVASGTAATVLSGPKTEVSTCTLTLGLDPNQLLLHIPITVPTSAHATELAHRIIQHHNLPVFMHQELSTKLKAFIEEKTEEYYRQQDSRALQAFQDGTVTTSHIVSQWKSRMKQKTNSENENRERDIFAAMYHSVVHSPAATNLLSLEHSYANAVSSIVAKKEEEVKALAERHTKEMESAVSAVGSRLTDDDVNALSARHIDESQFTEARWDSKITALREEQSREFKNFVFEAHAGREVTTPMSPKDISIANMDMILVEAEPNQEESFTIHLGAQMKQMHNLRLLSADVLQLCKYQTHDAIDIPPQRIQTSMSLYSHNLNGVVLLVDDRINTYTGIKRDFGRVCSRSTELHFPGLEDQLEKVRELVSDVVQWRRDNPPPQYECDEDSSPVPVPQHLKAGDFYVTRHSNLADVHLVYHMIVDDSLRSSDINSRHPVILGLRNVLKVACLGDVTTLTLPLLLTHTMSEEMTMSWCQKRAELVYKCVKGFMMEMASWGGAEMNNMQFLVPKGISEELFQNLATMLPSIFRVSNPLVIKSS